MALYQASGWPGPGPSTRLSPPGCLGQAGGPRPRVRRGWKSNAGQRLGPSKADPCSRRRAEAPADERVGQPALRGSVERQRLPELWAQCHPTSKAPPGGAGLPAHGSAVGWRRLAAAFLSNQDYRGIAAAVAGVESRVEEAAPWPAWLPYESSGSFRAGRGRDWNQGSGGCHIKYLICSAPSRSSRPRKQHSV